jgi:hypothetical protein
MGRRVRPDHPTATDPRAGDLMAVIIVQKGHGFASRDRAVPGGVKSRT